MPEREVKLFQLNLDSCSTWSATPGSLFPKVSKRIDRLSIIERANFRHPMTSDIHRVLPLSDQTSFVALSHDCANLWLSDRPSSAPCRFYQKSRDVLTAGGHSSAHSGLFLFGDDAGGVELFDVGAKAVAAAFDTTSFCTPECDDPAVCSIQFEPSGMMFAVRNVSHLQIWDVRVCDRPLAVHQVQSTPKGTRDAFESLFTAPGEVYAGLYGQGFVCWDWRRSLVINHRASKRIGKMGDAAIDMRKRVGEIVGNHQGTVMGVVATGSLYFYQLAQ
jgi:hypothetical protein